MNEEELQGRINGIMIAVEIALKEIFALRYGDIEKGAAVAASELDELVEVTESAFSAGDFRNGVVDTLHLIAHRLRGARDTR